MATIRPDALLQALMLAAFAMLLQSFASESLYAPAMGFFFGLAYLTDLRLPDRSPRPSRS